MADTTRRIYDASGRELKISETIPVWKWTDASMRTFNDFQWVLGETKTAPGDGSLCTSAWLHAYHDPLLAVLMDPVDGGYTTPRQGAQFWRGTGVLGATDGHKIGCSRLTLLAEEIPLAVTMAQRIRFAILCSLAVADSWGSERYRTWAEGWLSGRDRSPKSAEAWAAIWAAARAAARAAAEAAAIWAARAAETAAEAAARAAAEAAAVAAHPNLVALAYQAVAEEREERTDG